MLPFSPVEYANLLLIHPYTQQTAEKNFNTIAKLMQRGIPDANLNRSYTTEIEEIFNQDDKCGKIILIEGVAGIGKTILCKEIAYKWACNELIESDKLLLLVFLRDPTTKNINSVKDLVYYFYNFEDKSSDCSNISAKIISTAGIDVTIVLDGFDEISYVEDEAKFFRRLICKQVLPRSRIVVTSRPIASSMKMLQKMADVKVEILGFTKQNRQAFIDNALKNDQCKLAKLNSYLNQNSVIDHLCYIPFILSILVCLFKDSNELPKSRTEVYTKFIAYTISNFLRTLDLPCTISQLSELPPKYSTYFMELCRYAYSALQCDKIVFTSNEIKTGFPSFADAPSNWSGLGLLKSARYFNFKENNDRISYHFLHLSIQEYLAAYYITTCTTNQQLSILKKYFFNEKYLNMWIMYSGLCRNSLALRHFLSNKPFLFISKLFGVQKISSAKLQSKINCLYLLQCLPELGDATLYSHIGNVFENERLNLSGYELLEEDIDTLTSILDKSTTTDLKKLDLSDCNIGDGGCDRLCKNLQSIDHTLNFDRIDLSSNRLTGKSLSRLADILIHCQAKRVNLSYNFHIYYTVALYLAKTCAFKDTFKVFPLTVRINDQENIILKSLSTQQIISQFNPKFYITGVDLINCEINNKVITALRCINKSLYRLCIWNCDISKNLISHLLQTMSKDNRYKLFCVHLNSTLPDDKQFTEVIDFSSRNPLFMFIIFNEISLILHKVSDIHINYVILSSPTLPTTEKLVKVEMIRCEIYAETVNLLSNLFKQSRMLEKFVLAENNLKSTLLKQIFFSVKDCLSIKELYISDYNLIYDDYCHIADELSCNESHSIVLFCKNFLKLFRGFDDQLYDDIEKHISQLPEGTPLKISDFVAYETNLKSNDTNISLQVPHIYLGKSKLMLQKINDYLTTHMVIHSHSIKFINITEICFTNCKMKNGKVINNLFQKITECKQLTTFMYFDNDIIVDSTIFIHFLQTIIELSNIRKIFIHEKNKESNIISVEPIYNQLHDHPNLKAMIIYQDLVIGSGCNIKNYKKLNFPTTNDASTLLLQYCKINILELDKIMYNTQFSEVEIKNSVIDTEGIQPLECNTTRLNSLYLDFNQITESALYALFFIVSQSTALKELYLNNNQMKAEVTAQTRDSKQLYFYHDNTVDSTNCLAACFAASINNKKYLKRISLNETFLASAADLIAKALANKTTKLEEVRLYGSVGNSETLPLSISSIVTVTKSLKTLCLKDMNLKAKGMIKIAKCLCKISTLEILDLQNNAITEEAADKMALVIQSNNKLKELYLGNNLLQAGIIKIFIALKNISSLQMLDLENNNISNEVADELASAICCNTMLQKLWLDNNSNLKSSLTMISMACSKIYALQQLCLTNTGISKENGRDIAAIFSSNCTIERLSISHNNLQSQGLIIICQELAKKETLKCFHACGVNATAVASEELKSIINANLFLKELSLSDNLLQTGLIEIAESCNKLKGLKLLEFSHNDISPSDVLNLVSIIAKTCSLELLSLGGITLNVYENLSLCIKHYQKRVKTCTLYNDQQNLSELLCCEILKSITMQDFILHYNSIYISYTYGSIHLSYLLENIFDKVIRNKGEYESIIKEANEKLLQIDSKSMISLLKIIRTLKVINLENNNIDDTAAKELADHLKWNNVLEQLWLRGNELCDKGAKVVLNSLKNLSTLLILDLCFNNLSSESADAIAVVISNNSSLQQLWLDGNNLLTSGVVKITSALKKLSSLRIISLCSNGVTDDAAEEISDVITSNVLLVDLLLGNNQLKAVGVRIIAVALRKLVMLRKLDLFNNQITSDTAKELAITLTQSTNLQQLFLSDNKLETEGIIEIANALKCINSLQVLTISNNGINKSATDALVDVMNNNISLKVILINGNNLQTAGINMIIQSAKKLLALQLLDVSYNNVSEYKKYSFKKLFTSNINVILTV